MTENNAILEARGLSKTFATPTKPVQVLDEANVALAYGESLSIRGESGAGKTTLLYLLSVLENPDSGELFWAGENALMKPADWRARQRATFMGFVFQAYYLMPELSAVENVLLARRLVGKVRKEDRLRAEALLERVGLADRAKQIPSKLSGGEKQRVAVARALMNQPPLILADEPTGNLDERTGEHIMELLLTLCREEDMSLILVTHNPVFARQTDRCLMLHNGRFENA
ncbi:ABC transporter ATP-binding protein [Cerasicoccus arenae]|uniref:ABC transporter ATP-binding protein n=1 Tax=Cerasicoccus arenae TaxID=424488 RepID=A0A8J3DEU1_9BACT|nr:ABC transporter ATP-binding protein [Cerasicoccus arenae]MBK1857124.1 ABC transporter ATP-binding protein [Cerasicoccus arenae]GHB92506.1 ABC transporter ATP-binding protein [Cerasicoccus arenae]